MAFDKPIAVITVAAEASNQPHDAKQGVAASLLNRLALKRYGSTVAAVCVLKAQYSEWLGDAADNRNLERVVSLPDGDPMLLDCAVAYDEVAAGADPTHGATHFYAASIPEPYWAAAATFTVQLGQLRFFKGVP